MSTRITHELCCDVCGSVCGRDEYVYTAGAPLRQPVHMVPVGYGTEACDACWDLISGAVSNIGELRKIQLERAPERQEHVAPVISNKSLEDALDAISKLVDDRGLKLQVTPENFSKFYTTRATQGHDGAAIKRLLDKAKASSW